MPSDELGATSTLVAILQMAIHCYHRMDGIDDILWPKICAHVLAELGIAADEEEEYCAQTIERFHEET
jgi:hypothetical protein